MGKAEAVSAGVRLDRRLQRAKGRWEGAVAAYGKAGDRKKAAEWELMQVWVEWEVGRRTVLRRR